MNLTNPIILLVFSGPKDEREDVHFDRLLLFIWALVTLETLGSGERLPSLLHRYQWGGTDSFREEVIIVVKPNPFSCYGVAHVDYV